MDPLDTARCYNNLLLLLTEDKKVLVPYPPFQPQCSSKCARQLFIAAVRKPLKHSSHQCMMVCALEMGPSTPHSVCAAGGNQAVNMATLGKK